MTFKDHFSGHSAEYAARRPTYPPALVDFLADLAPGHELALDCACGSGQLSTLLASRFARVVATDASAQQIASAAPHPGVEYQTARAEESRLPDASADLLTVAQAAHWLDLDLFYVEARRVARPKGVLALITYNMLHTGNAEADRRVGRFYGATVGPYWPFERRIVEDGYRSLRFPFEEIAPPALEMEAFWSLDDLAGYIDTWSAVKAAEKALTAPNSG
jgi:ubiquinone/menaquinone biosynthesis C-methylase UbiE